MVFIISKEISLFGSKPERMKVREQLDVHELAKRFKKKLARSGFEFGGFDGFYFSEVQEAEMAECLADQRYFLGKILSGEEGFEEKYKELMESLEVQGEFGGVKVNSRDNITELGDRIFTTCYYAGLPLNQIMFYEGMFSVQDFEMNIVPGVFIYLFPYIDEDGRLGWIEARNSVNMEALDYLYTDGNIGNNLPIDPMDRNMLTSVVRRVREGEGFGLKKAFFAEGFEGQEALQYSQEGVFEKKYIIGKRDAGGASQRCFFEKAGQGFEGSGIIRFTEGEYWDKQTFFREGNKTMDGEALARKFLRDRFDNEPDTGSNVIASYVDDRHTMKMNEVMVHVEGSTVMGRFLYDVEFETKDGVHRYPAVIEAIIPGNPYKALVCIDELGLIKEVANVERGYPLNPDSVWAN